LIDSQKNIIDVLLTNGWDRIAYNVLRGLSSENLKVAFGTNKNKGMGAYSKYVSSKFVHSDYILDPEKFINDISGKITQLRPCVYMPTGEEIFAVAKYIDKFSKLDVKIPIAPYDTLIKLHNKSSSIKIARDLGIPVPKSIIPNSINEITDFAGEYGYPLIFKSFLSSSSKGVYFVNKIIAEKDLEEFLRKNYLNYGDFIVQQFVKGTGYGVSVLFNNGELKALFTHKRLRERIVSGGPSTLRISTHQSELEEYAVKLLKSANFHGVAMVEFKFDEDKKNAWFIEVNPRFWGSIGLAINSGINFPYLMYRMMIDGDINPVMDYKIGITNKWLLGNISAVINQVIATQNPVHLLNLVNKKDAFDDFYKDDPKPFFAMIYLMIKRNFKNKFSQ